MDPVSAAGIGMTVAGLCFQIFAGCIKGYQLFIDAQDMPASFQHLRVLLRIEQIRLLNWGEKIGLLEAMVEKPNRTLQQNRTLIIDILLEVQALFKSCTTVEAKYDHLLPQMGIVEKERGYNPDIFDKRFPSRTIPILEKALKMGEKISKIPERLLWSMIKKDSVESMARKLIDLNSSVEALLEDTALEQIHQMQQHIHLDLLQLNTSITELKEISTALKLKAKTDEDRTKAENTSTKHNAHPEGADIARLADFKAQQIQLENQSPNSLPLDAIEPNDIDVVVSDTTRPLAKYKGKSIWIEWKYVNVNLTLHPGWKNMIEDRIKKLVFLLQSPDMPPEFNAPQCLGYFYDDGEHDDDEWDDDEHEGERYGFLYAKPLYVLPNAMPCSLLQTIKAKRSNPPSLTERIGLAHAIARSLMYFHSVNWIHKGLRSENVILFCPKGEDPDLTRHPLIAGFEYARPDLPGEMTEPPPEYSEHDVYRRPSLVRGTVARSQNSHDIYSLGIILVEIAYWQHINEIINMPKDEKEAQAQVQNVRRLLLETSSMEVIESSTGKLYTEVVKTCLLGGEALGIPEDADETQEQVSTHLQDRFVDDVVDKLGNIRI